MKTQTFTLALFACLFPGSIACFAQDEMPFQHKVDVYRSADGDAVAFTVRLEQAFLAEEFEKSNFLRLRSDDERAWLIYPQQTKFEQKHAEFFGRLRGEGTVKLRLSYDTVLENLDGTRRVEAKEGIIEVEIPKVAAEDQKKAIGSQQIFKDWANQQNLHFARRQIADCRLAARLGREAALRRRRKARLPIDDIPNRQMKPVKSRTVDSVRSDFDNCIRHVTNLSFVARRPFICGRWSALISPLVYHPSVLECWKFMGRVARQRIG